MAESWLLLTDYSSKYRISVSTLRRRIKAADIRFKFEGGKYFLLDSPPAESPTALPKSSTPKTSASSPASAAPESKMKESLARAAVEAAPLKSIFANITETAQPQTAPKPQLELEASAAKDEPLMSIATKLLNELKLAYMSVLHEKEEQIIQLKEEVSDLKTLVRVLEDDNDRMRSILSPR